MIRITLITTILIALISCTPEEQVIDTAPTETTETNTEEPIEDDEEPTPEPTPEPVAFAGEWVLWGNYAPHCNCVQGVPELSNEPLLTIDEGGTLVLENVSYDWSLGGNLPNDCVLSNIDVDGFRDLEHTIASEDCGNNFLPDNDYIMIPAYGDGFILDGVYSRGYFILIRI